MPKLKTQNVRGSKLWFFALIYMVSLSACVKKSTFEALQVQYQNEQKQTEELKVKLVTTEAQRDQLGKDKNSLTQSFNEAKKKNTALLSDRSALQASVEEMQIALKEQARRQAEVEARIASFKALLELSKATIESFANLIALMRLHSASERYFSSICTVSRMTKSIFSFLVLIKRWISSIPTKALL